MSNRANNSSISVEVGGGSVETLIHTETISSSVATVDVDISGVSATYRRLRIEWDFDFTGSAAYQELFMILKLNGTWYSVNYVSSAQASNSSVNSGQNTTANIQLSSTISYNDTEQAGQCIIDNKVGRKRKGYGQFVGDAGNTWVMGINGWMYNGTDATAVIDAFRFSGTTNFTAGTIKVYGVND